MKKMLFKKILCILDIIEIHGIETDAVYPAIRKELDQDDIPYDDKELHHLIPYLFAHRFLKDTARGIDLSPCATIFARSDSNSYIETLALLECFYQTKQDRDIWQNILHQSNHQANCKPSFDAFSDSLLSQNNVFLQVDNRCVLHKEYQSDFLSIIDEYKKDPCLLLSATLCAHYTNTIVAHSAQEVEYKNQSNAIISYKNLSFIKKIIPTMGIPSDRSHTKQCQTFFKDTLFYEFDHACCLCRIDLAHMLVASHIKPFRDCAHIFEAADHNNGLLLCRNHDFLFDQGYISFADDGSLLIAQALRDKDLVPYQIDETMKLPERLLTEERRLFLAYHREHIQKL